MTDMATQRMEAPGIRAEAATREGAEEKRLGLRLTLPAQLLVIFIALFPILMQVYISLTDWSPLDGIPWYRAYELWIGLLNYADLAEDPRFWSALWRTCIVMAICVPAQFFLGLGLAVLFVDDFRGKRALYSAVLVPMMVVPAVAGYMFFMLFQSGGPVNDILSVFAGRPVTIAWLSDPDLALVATIMSDIWQWTPLMFLILLAGMLGVPSDQLLAAKLLGGSNWQNFIKIILPRMKTVIIIALVLRAVECFKIFDLVFIMTKGGPGVQTETISVFLYKQTFGELEWAYVATIGLSILIALSILAVKGLSYMAKK